MEAAATSTTVTLRRGGTIRGRLLTPAGTLEHVEVILRGPGFWLWGEPTVDGTFEIRAVPDGEWTIEAKRYVDGAWRSASTQARPGDVVEIDLRSP